MDHIKLVKPYFRNDKVLFLESVECSGGVSFEIRDSQDKFVRNDITFNSAFDLSSLDDGPYYLKIFAGASGFAAGKIIIEKK